MGDMVGDERAAALEEIRNQKLKCSRKRKEPDVAKRKNPPMQHPDLGDVENQFPKEQQTIDGAADTVTPRVKAAAKRHAKACFWYHKWGEDLKITKPALDKVMDEDKVKALDVTISEDDTSTRYKIKRSEVAATTKIVCEKQDE